MDQTKVLIHALDGSKIATIHIGDREEFGSFKKRIFDGIGLNLANFDMIFVRRRDFAIQSDCSTLNPLRPDPEGTTDKIGEGKIYSYFYY